MHIRFLLTCFVAISATFAFGQNKTYNINYSEDYTLTKSISDNPSLKNTRRHREFRINPVLQQANGVQKNDTIILDLFDDCQYMAYVTGIRTNIDGSTMINGRLKDYKFSSLFISTSEGKSYIQIDIPEKEELYSVNYLHDQDIYYLKQLEYNKNEMISKRVISPVINEKIQSKSIPQNNLRVTDEQVTIKLLVAYTRETIKWSNENATSISNVINVMMARNQLVLDNSKTNVKLELAAAVQVNYTEQDSMELDFINFVNINGYMDEVHTLRDYYYADAMLFISGKTYWGAGKGCLFSGNKEWAGAVVDSWGAVDLYSPIHEIGHILGAHHQKYIVENPPANTYNYGWGWHDTKDNGYYCTVMSYRHAEYWPDSITRIIVPHFSNPNVTYNEIATGVADVADNARRIRETKSFVADFRVENCAHPSTPTVSQIIQPDCNSDIGSITLSNLPNDTWKLLVLPANEVISGSGSSKTIFVSGGEYNIAVINANRCPSYPTNPIVIENTIPPAPKIDNITQPGCGNNTGVVEISNLPLKGELIILPQSGDNTTITNYTDPIKLGLEQGNYYFRSKSKFGCLSPKTEKIEINKPSNMPVIKAINPGCLDLYGILEVKNLPTEGWEIYKIENSKEFILASGSSETTSIEMSPGSYDVFVKSDGCSSENTTNIVIDPPKKPASPVIKVLSQPNCDYQYGNIEISNIPGKGELRFFHNNGMNFIDYDQVPYSGRLLAGSHEISVKDKSGCISDRTKVEINELPPYTDIPYVLDVNQPTCRNPFGNVTIDNLPEKGTLTVHSDAGDSKILSTPTKIYVDLLAGKYTFSVKTYGGCKADIKGDIVINDAPVTPEAPTIEAVSQPGCYDMYGAISFSNFPSGSWELFKIENSETSKIVKAEQKAISRNMDPGTYRFKVINSEGCESALTEEVTILPLIPIPPELKFEIVSQPTCHKSTGIVRFSNLPAGTWELHEYSPEKDLLLTGNAHTAEIEFSPGTYLVESITEDNCRSMLTDDIVISEQPVVEPPEIKIAQHPNCSDPTGSVSVSKLPEGAWTMTRIPDNKEFTGSGSEATIDNIPAGRYSFNVTNTESCTSKNSKHIDLFQISLISQPTISQKGLTLNASPADSYQWYLSNEPIEGATKKDYTVIKEGEYHVVVYDDQCYSKPSDKIYITINGIGDINAGLKVYPNPADSELSLELSGNNERVHVDIFSASGELFYSSEFTNSLSIDVKQWPSGIYIIKSFNNKIRFVNKFVKH